MSLPVIIGLAAFVLIVGSVIAVLWWNLAARAAPYKDELARDRERLRREDLQRNENVVVIGSGSAGAQDRHRDEHRS